MKLYAISDLHVGYRVNREALEALPARPQDWLILGGDVGETLAHLRFTFETLKRKFARLFWVPGNHELWSDADGLGGARKYLAMVDLCRSYGVVTPEDPYQYVQGKGRSYAIAPLFTLYDYSFRPAEVAHSEAVAWAREAGLLSRDEALLDPAPYSSRSAWCEARCTESARRLGEISPNSSVIIVNHFPLRHDLVKLKRIPRFSIWCGTTATHEWHLKFKAAVVISGHLHVRSTNWIDGVRFEEVSLGYPRHWDQRLGVGHYLREILPSCTASDPA